MAGALPKRLQAHVTIERIGGWNAAGQVAITFEEDLDGEFEVITRGHLYNWRRGIDIYPTKDQLAAILAGETVRRIKWC